MSKKTKANAALKSVATELNEICGLEPEIDVNSGQEEVLEKVKEAAALLEKNDTVSKKTTEYLKEAGYWPFADADKPSKKDSKKGKAAAETVHTEESLQATNFMVMKKIARELGASDAGKKPAVIAAILAAQNGDNAPAPKKEKEEKAKKEKAPKVEMPGFAEMSKKELKSAAKEAGVFEKGMAAEAMVKALTKAWKAANKSASTPKKKGTGVIASIAKLVEDAPKKGISKEDILKALVKAFPEREKDSMSKTINVQVPSRISKERFEVKSLGNGKYRKA